MRVGVYALYARPLGGAVQPLGCRRRGAIAAWFLMGYFSSGRYQRQAVGMCVRPLRAYIHTRVLRICVSVRCVVWCLAVQWIFHLKPIVCIYGTHEEGDSGCALTTESRGADEFQTNLLLVESAARQVCYTYENMFCAVKVSRRDYYLWVWLVMRNTPGSVYWHLRVALCVGGGISLGRRLLFSK